MPKISVRWNVIAWWEWTDVKCLHTLESKQLSPADFQHSIRYLTQPRHQDTEHLRALVTAMCTHGTCPAVVYMDVDFIYNNQYAVHVLRRNKLALATLNVTFGLDIVDVCGADLTFVVEVDPSGKVVEVDPSGKQLLRTHAQVLQQPNLLQEKSLRTVVRFLIEHGILDQETHLRIQSWTVRPIERGLRVNEATNGSMAHTANSSIQELLDQPMERGDDGF